MTTTYRVEIGGEVVWEDSFPDDDATTKRFPAQYIERPAEGEPAVTLILNDEIVGVQISQADEDAIAASPEGQARRRAEEEEAAAFAARVKNFVGEGGV